MERSELVDLDGTEGGQGAVGSHNGAPGLTCRLLPQLVPRDVTISLGVQSRIVFDDLIDNNQLASGAWSSLIYLRSRQSGSQDTRVQLSGQDNFRRDILVKSWAPKVYWDCKNCGL